MSETRFTPGPWSCNLPENGYIAIECMGNRIARVDVEADDPKVVESLTANARLIAAAPDLYAALSGLMDEIADCSQFDLWDNSEKALDALAKARREG